MSREEKTLEIMYGREDLSQIPIFQGGFINFGYWSHLPERPTQAERIEASRELYRHIFSLLSLTGEEAVLEVGSGRGLGCALLREQHRGSIIGLDVTPEQIERARAANPQITFVQGAAESMPFPDAHFQALYSVEAAQHFLSFPAFCKEAARVLAPGGKLALTTFFSEDDSVLPKLKKMILTVRKQIDRIIPLNEALTALNDAGFDSIQVERIGEKVWEGFDRWMEQNGRSETWGRNWRKAYQSQLLDYFTLSAEIPKN